jgi:multidrug efflux pump subunit AcrA (membrane-fusion protein)
VTNKDELLSQLRINRDDSVSHSGNARVWMGIAAVVVLALVGYSLLSKSSPVKVQIEMARMAVPDSSAATVLDATGYVVARRTATVSSKVTGKVAEIYIE